MIKSNIVLLCENNHYDALAQAAENSVLDKLNKKKWKHSLIESSQMLEDQTFTLVEKLDLYTLSLLERSTTDLCFRYPFDTKQKFMHYFEVHDFDVAYDERDALFEEINFCPKLDKLHSAIVDSEFFGTLTEYFFVDHPVEIKRDQDIVKNLFSISSQLQDSHAIGWIGQSHCIDFHHHLKETKSPLLEKILFININSQCSEESLVGLDVISALFGTYYFNNCFDDPRLADIVKKAFSFEKTIEDIQTPQEKIQEHWEKEFIASPHVLNVNISISDEPGSIFPWQLADLEIFN